MSPLDTAADSLVVWLDFGDPESGYLGWLAGRVRKAENAWGDMVRLARPWAPGEHGVGIGPSGEGKTTHLGGMCGIRKWVIAIDPKGEDDTLSSFGFERVRSVWQPGLRYWFEHRDDARIWRDAWKRIDDGQPVKLVIGGKSDSDEQVTALKLLMTDAVKFVQYVGGWTFYIDELEIATSQEMFNIRPYVNRMQIAARTKGTSVLSGYQAQAWVSKHPIRQCRKATMWSTGSREMIKAVAEGIGRDWRELAQVVDTIPQFVSATIPRGKHGGPIVLTSAPKVN